MGGVGGQTHDDDTLLHVLLNFVVTEVRGLTIKGEKDWLLIVVDKMNKDGDEPGFKVVNLHQSRL